MSLEVGELASRQSQHGPAMLVQQVNRHAQQFHDPYKQADLATHCRVVPVTLR